MRWVRPPGLRAGGTAGGSRCSSRRGSRPGDCAGHGLGAADVQFPAAAFGPPGGQDRLDQLPAGVGQIDGMVTTLSHVFWSTGCSRRRRAGHHADYPALGSRPQKRSPPHRVPVSKLTGTHDDRRLPLRRRREWHHHSARLGALPGRIRHRNRQRHASSPVDLQRRIQPAVDPRSITGRTECRNDSQPKCRARLALRLPLAPAPRPARSEEMCRTSGVHRGGAGTTEPVGSGGGTGAAPAVVPDPAMRTRPTLRAAVASPAASASFTR